MPTQPEVYVYAPAEAIIARPDLLDSVASKYDFRGVIIRNASQDATQIVQQHGLKAFWLGPGLWGHTPLALADPARFADVPAWDAETYPAYECQFLMGCAHTPGLAAATAAAYAELVRKLGADGVFGTHIRYHHPANIEHLWGCVCVHCRTKAAADRIDFDEIPRFLSRLATVLQQLPLDQWAQISPAEGAHPLVGWWAAVTETDFPLRWFSWKNTTIQRYIHELATGFQQAMPGLFFATNTFEPFLGALVGNAAETQMVSAWYAPLLGYWPHHVEQSLNNLAVWHAALSGQAVQADHLAAIMQIDSDVQEAMRQQIRTGAALASRIDRDYYPVFNGAAANPYGGTAEQFPLGQALELAEKAGAKGVIIQGISQLLDDASLDFWY